MKTLAQILRPIAAPQYAEQRSHIYRQYKKMLAVGLDIKTALTHCQRSVNSLIGNYVKISYEDLCRETITLCRKRDNGSVEVIAVCRPPKTPRGKATLEMVGSKKKRKFENVQKAYERLLKSIYRLYPEFTTQSMETMMLKTFVPLKKNIPLKNMKKMVYRCNFWHKTSQKPNTKNNRD